MNDTLELSRARVKVRYVNDPKPGKKLGTIKTYEDEYFYVRPEMLRIFQADAIYDLGFTETQGNNGLPLRTVQQAKAAADTESYPSRQAARRDAEPRREPERQPQNNDPYWRPKPRAPEDSQQIFVCAMLRTDIETNRVGAGEIELQDRAAMWARIWAATFTEVAAS